MPQLEPLTIFLASPSDVARERCYVDEVIEEINDTVASSLGIVLKVVHSGKTYPGFGQDGQTVLNKQIGNMKEYALFVGIMWSRIGTKTARAPSGTVEEFQRAVRSFNRNERPDIWFYFRQPTPQLDTEEKVEQYKQVLAFKKKVQRNALTCDYRNPSNFRDEFRRQISRWLNKRASKKPQSGSSINRSKKSSTSRVSSPQLTSTVSDRKGAKSTSTQKKLPPAAESIQKKPDARAKQPSSAASRSTTRAISSVNNSGAWVFLNETFFLTKSVVTQADQSVILHISPSDLEQEAVLRGLHSGRFHHKKQIPYAYQNEAAVMQVETVLSESVAGKTVFVVTLKPSQQSQESGNISEINFFNGYSADQIAELRARLLLLNEIPANQSKNDSFLTTQFINGYNSVLKVEKGIFPELWVRLKTQPKLFLPQARLAAVYHLKMSHTVEHILELKLGPLKNDVMPVRFRGRRKQVYSNQTPAVIEVVGKCALDA
jgi:hypothetical protein